MHTCRWMLIQKQKQFHRIRGLMNSAPFRCGRKQVLPIPSRCKHYIQCSFPRRLRVYALQTERTMAGLCGQLRVHKGTSILQTCHMQDLFNTGLTLFMVQEVFTQLLISATICLRQSFLTAVWSICPRIRVAHVLIHHLHMMPSTLRSPGLSDVNSRVLRGCMSARTQRVHKQIGVPQAGVRTLRSLIPLLYPPCPWDIRRTGLGHQTYMQPYQKIRSCSLFHSLIALHRCHPRNVCRFHCLPKATLIRSLLTMLYILLTGLLTSFFLWYTPCR